MRILLFSPYGGYDQRIASRRVNIFYTQLRAAGHYVKIVRLAADRDTPSSGESIDYNIEILCINALTRFIENTLTAGRPGLMLSLANFLRRLTLVDHFVYSIVGSVYKVFCIVKRDRIDTVITSSPPFSMAIVGAIIKRLCGVRFVSDNRDWWSAGAYNESSLKLVARIRKTIEIAVHQEASMVLTIGYNARAWYETVFQIPACAVLSGCPSRVRTPIDFKSSREIVYAGSLYGGKRRLDILLRALDCDELRRKFIVRLIGAEVQSYLKWSNTFPQLLIERFGPVSKCIADKMLRKSKYSIVLLGDDEFELQVLPAKFYELVSLARPLICIGSEDSEIGNLIRKNSLGICTFRSEVIRKYILESDAEPVQDLLPDCLCSDVTFSEFIRRLHVIDLE